MLRRWATATLSYSNPMFTNGAILDLDLIGEWRSEIGGLFDFRSPATDLRLLQLPIDQTPDIFRQCRQRLPPNELRQADRFRSALRSQAFVLGRGTVRMILGKLLGVPPIEVPLFIGQSGKP